MAEVRFVYVVYIASTPEQVWNALLDPQTTAQYWQHQNRSDWKPGSGWEHRRSDDEGTIDLVGKVVESAASATTMPKAYLHRCRRTNRG